MKRKSPTSRADLTAMIANHRSDECLLWPGATDRHGNAKCGGVLARRYAYDGDIPEAHYVRNTCGDGLCVNPKHLTLQKTNTVKPATFTREQQRRDRKPRVESDIAYVPLTKGYEAIIDAADADLVGQYVWYYEKKYGIDYALRSRRQHETGPNNQSLHQFLCEVPEGYEIDHKNGNGLDNRRCNLRVVTHKQNMWNRTYTPTMGVRQVKTGFVAQIFHDGKSVYLGTFKTQSAAVRAYNKAADKLRGEFSHTRRLTRSDRMVS